MISISLTIVSLLKSSISYWVNCGNLCFSKKWSISIKLSHSFHSLISLLISARSVLISLFYF